ncbi:cyclitol oxidoreductase [Streptomyces albus]|uniref:Cyclitol oxidoreductase n=1 Tax=Streptomyces albus (strain ATCC 21838 / DSM 41398 / FERM P-419 / JCM 4703 / NBRC 107858) TaxID=1081613 RepID=C6ZEY9_STRA4|nr:cyclitol oxidoreductase [Streptomyces albus]AJE80968.1 cyclitol oxidoreductase [Streptomyces albus]AOU75280.1 cyclitol oxidoreductase [Streptomyces albus]AYN31085.1 oxidoreductase [Streptomyces albus]
MTTDTPLADHRALVVGGSTGIGRGIADAWAAAGAEVVVCSRSRPTGPGAEALRWEALDLTRPEQAHPRLYELASGPLKAVCFASVHYGAGRAPFSEVAEQEWLDQLAVNTTGLWHTLAASLPSLRTAAPGLFLGVSSEVAFNAGPGRSGYAATKAASKTLLDSVAQEEDSAAVRIVQVLPAGMVDSPGIRNRRPEDFDFSSYMKPSDFGALARELAVTSGEKYHGDSLVVGGDGQWWSAYGSAPVSQTRSVRS